MKIRDILASISSLDPIGKVYTAYRIYSCAPKIKSAIKQWKKDEYLPIVRIVVETDNDDFVAISSYDLVNLYGFDELSALLMLNDIEKAQENNNKERLSILLSGLLNGKHKKNFVIPKHVFEDIKNNLPDVWSEYQKLCEKEMGIVSSMQKEYSQIIETEL